MTELIANSELSLQSAIGNLFESMDFCDATRSHEAMPSYRLQSRYATRRTLRALAVGFVSVAALVALAAWR